MNKSNVSSEFGLITTTSGASSVVYIDASGNICSTDGTNTCTNSYAYTADEELTILASWGDNLNLSVNGNAATQQSFDGAFADSGQLTHAWSLPDGFALVLNSLKWYDQEIV